MRGDVVYKMCGSGNDFIFADGRRTPLTDWPATRIRRICHRRLSLGADGLVVLEPGAGPSAVRFHFFNSDGGRAAMCGNAALCATRLSAWLGLAPAEGMQLETDAGTYSTRCLPEADRAEIGLGAVAEVSRPELEPGPGEGQIAFAVVGVPHLIVAVDDLEAVDLPNRGRELRTHPAVGPQGANVNFVGRRREAWGMRTYERGVEGETLACGTGAVAAAAALHSLGLAELPWSVRTASGSILTVSGSPPDDSGSTILTDVFLAGEGRLVFRAVLGSE